MIDIRWRNSVLLSLAVSFLALGYGWLAYGWHHNKNRHVPPATLASASRTLIAVPLDVWVAPSGTKAGDRLDILASTEERSVLLVFDAPVLANNLRGCYCLMPLADGQMLSQAMRNGLKITCRPSIVPGKWKNGTF